MYLPIPLGGSRSPPAPAGQASIDPAARRLRHAHLVHLPVHASWRNQVEIFSSVVQRKVLTSNDFTDLDEVQARLLAFQTPYEARAQPSEWKFTPHDPDLLLTRLAAHEALPTAA